MLGTVLILNTVAVNVRTTCVVTGDAYGVVGLSAIMVIVEPTHDYDLLLACGGQVESRRCFEFDESESDDPVVQKVGISPLFIYHSAFRSPYLVLIIGSSKGKTSLVTVGQKLLKIHLKRF